MNANQIPTWVSTFLKDERMILLTKEGTSLETKCCKRYFSVFFAPLISAESFGRGLSCGNKGLKNSPKTFGSCSGSAASSSPFSVRTLTNAVIVTAWGPCGSFVLRVLMQAMADFLTDDTGLHKGTIKEGITEKKKQMVNLIFYLSNLKNVYILRKIVNMSDFVKCHQ